LLRLLSQGVQMRLPWRTAPPRCFRLALPAPGVDNWRVLSMHHRLTNEAPIEIQGVDKARSPGSIRVAYALNDLRGPARLSVC